MCVNRFHGNDKFDLLRSNLTDFHKSLREVRKISMNTKCLIAINLRLGSVFMIQFGNLKIIMGTLIKAIVKFDTC